jgi:hypothetical protein
MLEVALQENHSRDFRNLQEAWWNLAVTLGDKRIVRDIFHAPPRRSRTGNLSQGDKRIVRDIFQAEEEWWNLKEGRMRPRQRNLKEGWGPGGETEGRMRPAAGSNGIDWLVQLRQAFYFVVTGVWITISMRPTSINRPGYFQQWEVGWNLETSRSEKAQRWKKCYLFQWVSMSCQLMKVFYPIDSENWHLCTEPIINSDKENWIKNNGLNAKRSIAFDFNRSIWLLFIWSNIGPFWFDLHFLRVNKHRFLRNNQAFTSNVFENSNQSREW